MTPPLVLDLSNNNGLPTLAWLEEAKRAGVVGVWLKATEGATFTDPVAASSAELARKAGLRVGFYHFAYPTRLSPVGGDWLEEARHFAERVKRLGTHPDDLRPVLDLEVAPAGYLGLEQWARLWNQEVCRLLGVGPLFYSYPAFIASMQARAPIGWGLWLASYGQNDGRDHGYLVPKPWRRVVAHQYTSRGTIAGRSHLDLSTVSSLRAIVAEPWRLEV